MAYWLFKSEPDVWSWEKQKAKGKAGEEWTGVRNYQARNNMRAMKLGDKGFFYHSNEGKEIVGIVEVIKTFYPDPSDESGKFGMVDFKAVKALKNPVSLDMIKREAKLKDMVLVNNSRLSVQPVTAAEWAFISKMGGV